jgi:hypothetical protein
VVLDGVAIADDLTIGDEVGATRRGEQLGELGIGVVEPFVVAGPQLWPPPITDGQGAHAVQLALEDPVVVGEPAIGRRGEHQLGRIDHLSSR